ncbi:MAG: hypothetical protein IJ509_00315, partial [Bacilli bacterium]|nr:hypothetical protein [Bacilli bacterium]
MPINSRKLWGTIIGVLGFVGLILVVTYARYVWKSEDTLLTFNFSDEYFYCESGIEKEIGELSPVLDYREGVYQIFGVNNIGRSDTTF